MEREKGVSDERKHLLSVLVNLYEIVVFIDASTRSMNVYTKDAALNNCNPYYVASYAEHMQHFIEKHIQERHRKEAAEKFDLGFLVQRLLRGEGQYEFILPYLVKGELRYKQIMALWGDEQHDSVCLVRVDITNTLMNEWEAKKQLEKALMMAKEANRAKTEVLSAMSHDMRTPMNGIIGMTQLAMENPDDRKQLMESLNMIKLSSEHLLNLINNILDMSRIEHGGLNLKDKHFSHREEMEKLIARSKAVAESRGVQFHGSMEITHDLVCGDALRIHEILDNLIGNAIKFTPKGGRVRFDLRELAQTGEQIGVYQYKVTDNGIGMSEEDIQRIFEPFFRSEIARQKNEEGSGLGLPIVKNLVEHMGGHIHVDASRGRGSCFTIEIPIKLVQVKTAEHSEKTEKKTEKRDLEGMKILLIEDHPVNQLVATKILESMNAMVTVAENGYEGAELFKKSANGRFDAVCMDIQMPVMDGYQATEEIRNSAHPQAKTIPIIAMTANAFLSDVRLCLERGMNEHVAKPIDPARLFAVLKAVKKGSLG